ncbi:hypothetical protein J2T57_001034 [Natronocella acetinitrilica]|jgi:hypothetical protein|uniref:COMM domain-containing protein n=1 Tax=Natronocella acetinitrilica TaxID=414046 RepID=A0AAE3G1L1_9GAMM|nr:hypothetical protein [Natronocella acetinitrilica]MCP1673935.1 hypothetical protein [Natronocella acetinitrilica]
MAEVRQGEQGDEDGLHCLGGSPPAAAITEKFRLLLSLPDQAARNLWPLIESVLGDSDADVSQLTQYFAQQHNVEAGRVLGALQVCEALLRQAAAMNVSAEEFQHDLEVLGPGSAMPMQLLMPNFESAMHWLRGKILERSLADHGKVVTSLDWRIEQVHASSHGAGLDTRVMHLAIRYLEGDEKGVVRLQLTPTAAQALSKLLSELTRAGRDQPESSGPQ